MSWEIISLGEAATFVNGYAFKPTDWSDNGLEIIRIQNLTKGAAQINYFEGELNDKYKVRYGDILISWSATLGVYEWKKEDAWLNQHLFKVIFDKKEMDKSFFIHLITSSLRKMEEQVHGATMKHITKKKFDAFKIPLPPLPEQRRIAALLDEADKLRQLNKQLITKYNNLTQSLFLDMFGDPVTNPKGWEKNMCGKYIDYLADIGSNGANKIVSEKLVMSEIEDYAIMIRTTNLSRNDFTNNLKYVSKEVYDFFKKSQIFGGEIIMNKIGSAGDFWLMPTLSKPVSLGLNQFVIRLKDIDIMYFYYFLSTDYGRKNIKSKLNGATTKSITKTAVRELPINVPPITLQNEFAERVAVIEAQKAQAQQSLVKAEELFGALLQRCFGSAQHP